MTVVKRCPRCGQLKSAEEFYRRGRGRRLSSYCQPCTQAASHQARGRRRQDPAAVELLRRWTGLASAATGPSAARVVMAGDRRTSARA
jgi:hypothetical protein